MTDSFLPFQHLIDPDRALRILRGATDGADDGELFLERTRSESLVFDDRRLRNAGYGAAQGFGYGIAETFVREGAKVAVLDPLEGISDKSAGTDYLSVMRSNLATVQQGQGCS